MKGLLLTLKKRRPIATNTGAIGVANMGESKETPLNAGNREIEHYSVLGYYDELEVKECASLHDFAPNSQSEETRRPRKRSVFANKFSIRLIAPKDTVRSKNGDCFIENPFNNNKMPLLSIMLLRLTQSQMKDFTLEENLQKIADMIANTFSSKTPGDTTRFSLYYSLGSADIAVLCFSSSYESAFTALYDLRARVGLLAESYMVPCIKEQDSGTTLDETALSIRVQFGKGGSVKKFIDAFEDELKTLKINDSALTYHRISGNSDLLILTGMSLSAFVKLYQRGGLLSQCNEDYELIVRTSIRMETTPDNEIIIDDSKYREDRDAFLKHRLESNEKKLNEFHDLLAWHIDNFTFNSYRILEGYMLMLNSYLDVSDNNYVVRYMLDPVLDFLINILKHDQTLRDAHQKNGRLKDANEIAKRTDSALNQFREYFTEVINDLSRSDRQFIEGRVLVHQVMGTSQKIIFSYSAVVQEIASFLARKDGNCCFLVTSGGADAVQVVPYFNHLNDQGTHILALMLPEKNLYNVETLFSVIHEIFHFAGDRMRGKREQYLIDSLICQYATVVADDLFNEFLARRIRLEYGEKAIDGHKVVFYRNTLRKNIMKVISHYLGKSKLKGNLLYFGKTDAMNALASEISKILNPSNDEELAKYRGNPDVGRPPEDSRILRAYAYVYEHLWENIKKEQNNRPSKSIEWEITVENIENPKTVHRRFKGDDALNGCTAARVFLDWYTGRYNHGRTSVDADPEKQNPEECCQEIMKLYQECYADISSAVLLGYTTLEDYIAVIAPDFKTLCSNMPDNDAGRARIFSVMNVLYFGNIVKKVIGDFAVSNEPVDEDIIMVKIAGCIKIKVLLAVKNDDDAEKIADYMLYSYAEYHQKLDIYTPLEKYLESCARNLQSTLKPALFVEQLREFYRIEDENEIVSAVTKLLHTRASRADGTKAVN
jgi:hypothetical protein